VKKVSHQLRAKRAALSCLLAALLPAIASAEEPQSARELHCVVMPSAVVDVASGVSGRVDAIYVERGDAVRAGQVVAALESGVELANLELAKARAGLEADVRLRQARLAFEERKLDRTDRLRSNRVVSAHEQDEAKTEAVLAQWQLRQAIDDRYLAGLELARAAEMLKRRSVESPIDGVVVDRFKWPGEYVEEEPVLRVARLDPLWVEVVAPVTMHGEVERNMLAEVFIETATAQLHEARVTVIDPMGDAASGTFRVRLELPNPDHRLLGGTKCKARFPTPARYAPETMEDPAREATPAAPWRDIERPHGAASADLSPADGAAIVVTRGEEKAESYIVATPVLGSAAERRRVVSKLKDAGVRDFHALTKGPFAGRISLGVYNPLHLAEQRRAELAALGFEAEVLAREAGGVPSDAGRIASTDSVVGR